MHVSIKWLGVNKPGYPSHSFVIGVIQAIGSRGYVTYGSNKQSGRWRGF